MLEINQNNKAEIETMLKSPFAVLMCQSCLETLRDIASGRIESIRNDGSCWSITKGAEPQKENPDGGKSK